MEPSGEWKLGTPRAGWGLLFSGLLGLVQTACIGRETPVSAQREQDSADASAEVAGDASSSPGNAGQPPESPDSGTPAFTGRVTALAPPPGPAAVPAECAPSGISPDPAELESCPAALLECVDTGSTEAVARACLMAVPDACLSCLAANFRSCAWGGSCKAEAESWECCLREQCPGLLEECLSTSAKACAAEDELLYQCETTQTQCPWLPPVCFEASSLVEVQPLVDSEGSGGSPSTSGGPENAAGGTESGGSENAAGGTENGGSENAAGGTENGGSENAAGGTGSAGTENGGDGGDGGTENGGDGGAATEACPSGWTGEDCSQCVRYVAQASGSEAADGMSWESAKSTLQDGVDAAESDSCAVWVAEGTYFASLKPDPFGPAHTATLWLPGGVDIYGGFVGGESAFAEQDAFNHPTIISGEVAGAGELSDNVTRLVSTQGATRLQRLTLRGAYSETEGAALYCAAGNLVLVDVLIEGNHAEEGAALFVTELCTAEVVGSRFVGNESERDGGAVWSAGFTQLEDCQFDDNRALSGAAVKSVSGRLEVTGSTFQLNYSRGAGGAIQSLSELSVSSSGFSGNEAASSGGAIWATSGRIEDSDFLNNVAGTGGAVLGSDLVLIQGYFAANTATSRGGGVRLSGTSRIENCSFQSNSGYTGGAVYSEDMIEVLKSRFGSNQASEGGALYLQGAGSVFSSRFSGNRATGATGRGGAIYLFGAGAVELANSQLTENTATFEGGAIYSRSGDEGLRISHLSLVANQAEETGGGLHNARGAVLLDNSIFWKNGALDGPQLFNASAEATAELHYCNVQGTGFNGTAGNIDADPLFVDEDFGDLTLSSGSPCIDSGEDAAIPADTLDVDGDGDATEALPLDLNGATRVMGAAVDMGAHEAAP